MTKQTGARGFILSAFLASFSAIAASTTPTLVTRVSQTLVAEDALRESLIEKALERIGKSDYSLLIGSQDIFLAGLGADLKTKYSDAAAFNALADARQSRRGEHEVQYDISSALKLISSDQGAAKVSLQLTYVSAKINPAKPAAVIVYTTVIESILSIPTNPSSSDIQNAIAKSTDFVVVGLSEKSASLRAQSGGE